MNTENAALALQLLITLIEHTQEIAQLIQTAQSENRDVTSAELDALAINDDDERKHLQGQIDAVKAASGQ